MAPTENVLRKGEFAVNWEEQSYRRIIFYFQNENVVSNINRCTFIKARTKQSCLLRLLGFRWIHDSCFVVARVKLSNKLQGTGSKSFKRCTHMVD